MMYILATWRLAHLLHDEDGPFDLFGRLRDLSGIKYDEYNTPYSNNQIGKMLICFWCTSIWASIFVCILRRKISIVDILAISGGAILLEGLRK